VVEKGMVSFFAPYLVDFLFGLGILPEANRS